MRLALIVLAVLGVASAAADAQWPRQRSTLPRGADGRVDLTAPAPRTADGRPDLAGVWEQYGEFEQPRYLLNIAADLKAEEAPLQPWARELVQQRRAKQGAEHPRTLSAVRDPGKERRAGADENRPDARPGPRAL